MFRQGGRWINLLNINTLASTDSNDEVFGVDAHRRERTGLTGELLADLIEMVQVDVGVAGGVDEIIWLQAAYLW